MRALWGDTRQMALGMLVTGKDRTGRPSVISHRTPDTLTDNNDTITGIGVPAADCYAKEVVTRRSPDARVISQSPPRLPPRLAHITDDSG